MRSRAVSLFLACWRSTARSEPACSACSLRLARSSRRSDIGCSDIAGKATARRPPDRESAGRAECAIVPVEPPPSVWRFERPPDDMVGEVVATGGDLEPGTILAAYRAGQFPMPLDGRLL